MAINLDNITIDRIGWKDDPDTSTSLDSGNLKEMENNSEAGINTLKSNVQIALTELESKTNELNTEIDNLKNYSTEEVKTGETWIDGKPIYRKTLTYTNKEIGDTTSIAHNIPNIDKITDYEGRFDDEGETYTFPLLYKGTNSMMFMRCTKTSIVFKTYDSLTFSAKPNREFTFTLKYTKTTD